MSTIHLTKEEKKALKAEQMRKRWAAYHSRQAKKNLSMKGVHNKKLPIAHPPPVKIPLPPGTEVVLADPPEPKKLVIPVRQVYEACDDTLKPSEFMEEIAKQPGFMDAMGENINDPRVAKFLKLCGEVENRSLTWIARSCKLTTLDLARIWRDDVLARAFFRIVNRMPQVADKMVDDSLGDHKACRRCDGMRNIEVPQKFREFFDGASMAPCPECGGKGFVVEVGSAPHTQMILEKVGWAKQRGGVSVNVNMNEHRVDATIDEMDEIDVLEHRA